MTALGHNINNPVSVHDVNEDSAAAAVHVYVGALVSVDTSGNARPGRATATDRVRGICVRECDNSAGDAGDKLVKTRVGVGYFVNSAAADEITAAEVESACYIVDDATVAKTSNSGARPAAGKVLGLENGKVKVLVGDMVSASGDLVAALNLSDVDDAPTARANIGANVVYLTVSVPLNSSTTTRFTIPDAFTVAKITSVVEGATTATSDATITAAIGGTPVTNGVVTVGTGSTVGTVDSATPTAANTGAADAVLSLAVDHGTQSAASTARVTVKLTR